MMWAKAISTHFLSDLTNLSNLNRHEISFIINILLVLLSIKFEFTRHKNLHEINIIKLKNISVLKLYDFDNFAYHLLLNIPSH